MTESGRGVRRKATTERGGKKFKGALAELRALKASGKKRIDSFEVNVEDDVYDEVGEEDYARLVQKRREEGGGFVVGNDDLGYTDIGEEVDWIDEDARMAEKKAKTDKKAAGRKAGGAKGTEPVAGAKERMQKMFQSAAVRAKAGGANVVRKPKVNAAETDALLDDILGDLDTPGGQKTPRTAVAARTQPQRAPVASRMKPGVRVAVGSVARSGGAARAFQTPMTTTSKRVQFEDGVVAGRDAGDGADGAMLFDDDDGGDYNYGPLDDELADYGKAEPVEAEAAAEEVPMEVDAPEAATAMTTATAKVEVVDPIEADADADAINTGNDNAGPADAPAVASDWQALYEDDLEDAQEEEETPWVDDGSLQLDGESRMSMYLIDAHEEVANSGTVYLFGKTPVGDGQFASCCTIVKNIQKTVFVVPRTAVDLPADHLETAADAEEKKERMLALHGAFAEVKAEVTGILKKMGINKMTMKPVPRTYAFEDQSVSHGSQWVLKVRFPQGKALPLTISGNSFVKMFGTTQSSLESLMLKRRIMGPSWIHVTKPTRVGKGSQVSYCDIEVQVEGHKTVIAAPSGWKPAPPICVASLSMKTVVNPDTAANEVVSVSVVYMPKVNTDGPLPVSKRDIRHFSAIRKLTGMGYPAGFDAMAKKANDSELGKRNGGNIIALQPNERALLTGLVMKLKDLDVDAFVGHNFSGFDLDVLLHRMKELKVPHWACLGRLKRSKFPNLGGGGHSHGGGAGAGALSVVAGRLICDTYLAARELVREAEYSLTALSRNLLGEIRAEVSSSDIKSKFLSSDKLVQMIQHTESDAWLSMRLASFLAVLPLTRQLAELSGSLWSKALLNQRAQRIEYLLLHEFHNNKFILPDKMTAKERAASVEGAGGSGTSAKKGGKGPQYAGGLVLEPKKGLYDRYILLLDFNSLYPSIIQEYNICFTTVERPPEGAMARLPDASGEKAPLPRVIGTLVDRRRRVKEMIKGERDSVKKEQLNIRQQAIKLLANSMYGCLGFSNSRFYAKPLAELITSQGREILQSTVELVQGNIGRTVVYGDTDSIMVDTSTDQLADVIALGHIIKKEVNKRYRLLEIEMDGVFKRMLLLKKKKYAAVKVERGPDGKDVEIIEAKGLDMVRRDWCPLAKQASQFCLDQILSGKPREEVVGAIHDHLSTLGAAVRDGTVPLGRYVVTKQLTKRPEDYPDAKNQPHVQVALRRRAAGKRDGVMPGETIPYIICVDEEGKASLADRARSPEEISASNGALKVDVDYYIAQQVFPVICRLVAPIEGTDAAHIAESLGMDGTKYKAGGMMSSINPEEALDIALAGLDDDDRFKECPNLELKTPSGKKIKFDGVRDLLKLDGDANAKVFVSGSAGSAADSSAKDASATVTDKPLTPAQVSNQVRLRARANIKKYYDGWLVSDDEMLPCRTRNVCLRDLPDSMPGTAPSDFKCSGTMHPEVSEARLYTELSFLHRLFDTQGAMKDFKKEAKEAAEARLQPVRATLDFTAAQAALLMNKSAYRWVDLKTVFSNLRVMKKRRPAVVGMAR